MKRQHEKTRGTTRVPRNSLLFRKKHLLDINVPDKRSFIFCIAAALFGCRNKNGNKRDPKEYEVNLFLFKYDII